MRSSRTGLFVHAFLLQLATYVIRPAAAYQVIELGADPAFVGVIAASFALLPLILALLVGRWIDAGKGGAALRLGSAMMLTGGLGLLFLGGSLWALALWNALIGLGHLLGILGEQNIVARAGEGDIDRAFGIYTFVVSGGQALAPLLLGIAGGGGVMPWIPGILIVYSVTCAVLIVVSFLLRSPADPKPEQRPVSLRGAMTLGSGTRLTMTGAILSSCFVLAGIDLIQVYLPVLGVERDIPAWIIGVLLSVRAFATMLSRLGLGALTRRFSRRALITVSTLIGAVAVGLLAVPLPLAVIAALLIVAGLTLGIGQPLTMSIISLAAPPGTLATWLAVRLTANRFGQSGVPIIMGLVALGSAVTGVFSATGAMLLATAVLSWIALPRR